MKPILKIAKTELSTLFYSPVAWLVLIVFVFQSGLQFANLLEKFESWQEIGRELEHVSELMFTDPMRSALFIDVKRNLYLYIPLLTMGLMSREISSGSIKLLLSSPVRNSEIVLGKYLSMMAYGLLLIASLALIIIAAHVSIHALDTGLLISGLLGLYLLICAYAAIGLFMSCLTSYQVVAAISTLVVFAVLNYIGRVGQGIDFIRDLTYFLSISGRVDQMINGLISSKDIIYFVVVIGMFLGFSMLKLQSGRESTGAWVKASRYVALFATILLIGYISSRPSFIGYYDMTRTKTQTLTVSSQQLLKQVKDPVSITSYVNILDRFYTFGLPEQRNNDMARLEQYTRFLPGIQFSYVYYYDSSRFEYLYSSNPGLDSKAIAQKTAKSQKMNFNKVLSPSQIRQQIDLSPEENRYVKILTIGNKRTAIRMFNDTKVFPEEAEISAAFKRLLESPSKVAFLSGDNERDIDKEGDNDYKLATTELPFRFSLINQGFEVNKLSLKEQTIPSDIACLVIADPVFNPDTITIHKIRQYIDEGRNLLVCVEPKRQQLLSPLLNYLGVGVEEGTVVEKSKDFAPDFIIAGLTEQAGSIEKSYIRLRQKKALISLPGVCGLTYTDTGAFKITPLLVTDSAQTWSKAGILNMDSSNLRYMPEGGDRKKILTTALALTRKIKNKDQRIVISGDADFMSNKEFSRYRPDTKNFAFFIGLFKWLGNDRFPVDTQRPDSGDDHFNIGQDGISIIRTLYLIVLPGLLLIGSALLLLRRKRK